MTPRLLTLNKVGLHQNHTLDIRKANLIREKKTNTAK